METNRKVLVIALGGTISQTHNESGIAKSDDASFGGGAFADILNKSKVKSNISVIDAVTISNKDSSNMTMGDWQNLVNTIVDNYDDYDAFIVTHGTNTMGYTTSAVSFALGNIGKPIAFTGSQVSYGIAGSDATMNLENILRVFTEKPELVGVFLVFGSKIITGTRVKKRTEFDYDAFKTFGRLPDVGHIGNSLSSNGVSFTSHIKLNGGTAKCRADLVIKNKFDPNIVSLTEFPGLRSDVIINLAKSGVKGFILRATGAGDPNVTDGPVSYPTLNEAFEYLQQHKIPIVVTTQAPDGVASMAVNEPGCVAARMGAIPAWDMSMESMVSKLSWLIANNYTYDEIRTLMVTSLRGEIDI